MEQRSDEWFAARAAHPVTDGEDHFEPVEGDRPLHLAGALGLNCQVFLDS